MGKPRHQLYDAFTARYAALNKKAGQEQFIVPYFMSSHPGSDLNAAIELALYLKRSGQRPEQVQDFYPTPGTLSTCMYYTGIDPRSGERVYVARDAEEKAMQRALLQASRPENRADALLPPRDIHKPAEKAGKNAGTEKRNFIKENRPKQTNHKKSQKRP